MLTLFWVVGVTNAFNLLDNMDGLCAGIGVIVAGPCSSGLRRRGRGSGREVRRARHRRARGFLLYNFNPGVDLHGRQRQPLHRA
jgi:UDP-GlcNAc:undecaprenyl-phosphate/decaprenyl-phosphate GlcNAc-1-phosphate transferase